MLASLTVSLIAILYPILTREMLNNYIPNGKYRLVVFAGLGLLLLYIVRMLLNYWIQFYGHIMGVKMQAQMRSELFSQLEKLPYMLLVGDKEIEDGAVSIRKRGEGDLGAKSVDEFIASTLADIASKKIW